MSTLPEGVQAERPLSSTQVRNLEKLVNTDFASVRSDIELYFTKKYKEEEAVLEANASDELKEALTKKACKARDTYLRARERLIKEADVIGLELVLPVLVHRSGLDPLQVKLTDTKLVKEKAKLKERIDKEKQNVLELSRKQQHAANRQIFLAGVSTQAEEILKNIPSAAVLLAEAMEETKEITS